MFVFSDFVTFTKLHVLLLWLKFNRYTQIALSAVWYVGIAVVIYSLSIILQQNNVKSCFHFVALRNTSFTSTRSVQYKRENISIDFNQQGTTAICYKTSKNFTVQAIVLFCRYLICFKNMFTVFIIVKQLLLNHALHAIAAINIKRFCLMFVKKQIQTLITG